MQCDENQHASYDASCDVRRDFDIVAAVTLGSAHKLKIIHFNKKLDFFHSGSNISMQHFENYWIYSFPLNHFQVVLKIHNTDYFSLYSLSIRNL